MKAATQIRFGRYIFECDQRILLLEGNLVPVSPKVLKALELLLAAEGRVVSKEEFMEKLWPNTYVEDSNLTQNIFILRKVLGVNELGRPYIETIPKRGYRLTVPVERVEVPADAPAILSTGSPDGRKHLQGGTAAWESNGLGAPRMKRLPVALWGSAVLVCCLLLAGAAWRLLRRAQHPVVVTTRRLTNDGVPKNLGPFPVPLVGDGKHLYFTEKRDNQSLLAHLSLQDGEVESAPAPFPGAAVVDYSPRTHALLIGSIWHTEDDRPILVQPRAGAALSQVGALTGHDASWSPDATRIAFTRGSSLYLASADGSHIRSIVSARGIVYWPRWSPDGKTLRFSENFGGSTVQLWQVSADGGGLHQLFTDRPEGNQVCCGAWSGDGRYFFYLEGGPAANRIWMVPVHASWGQRPAPVVLAVGAADMWHSPLPDASGHRVWAIGSHLRGELVRIDPKTRQAMPFLGGISAEGVSFSPDGASMAYTSYPDGTLWRSRTDGSQKVRLTRPPLVARFPRWSPDGRTIAFLAGQAGAPWRIYLLSVESGQARPLLNEEGSEGVPSWSPDGGTLAFGRLPDYGPEQSAHMSVVVYDMNRHAAWELPGSRGLWTPRWSPDGRYLTAVTGDDRALRLFDWRTRQWSDLAKIGANDVVWSPDSRCVYFDPVFGEGPVLYRTCIADRKLERWADLRGLRRGGFFGPWLGITPDGAPLMLRDTAIEEIYEMSIEMQR